MPAGGFLIQTWGLEPQSRFQTGLLQPDLLFSVNMKTPKYQRNLHRDPGSYVGIYVSNETASPSDAVTFKFFSVEQSLSLKNSEH